MSDLEKAIEDLEKLYGRPEYKYASICVSLFRLFKGFKDVEGD